MRFLRLASLALCAAALSAQTESRADSLAELRELIPKALAELHVPGVALAIVRDDRILICEGHGLRDIEQKLPVTTDTLFAIGSCTKAFTAALLGLLVEEGKLAWDEPLVTYLPELRLADRTMKELLTPRDLLLHRSGLPRHDLVWYGSSATRDELVASLAHLEANAPFRSTWQYQNLLYATAGHLAGVVGHSSWEELVRARLLAPLAITRASFRVAELQADPDHARPYAFAHEKLVELPFRSLDAVGPAGSINASVAAMAQWARMWLAGGKRILSASLVAELHRPQVVLPAQPPDAEILLPCYALGWFTDAYRGKLRVYHGGNIDGFSALVSLLPKERLGIVVLTNRNGTPLPEVLARHATDALLDLPRIDWLRRQLDREAKARASQPASKPAKDRKPGTKPAHALDEYCGEYAHPGYGTLTVARSGDALVASVHGIALTLAHWHFETFEGTPKDAMLEGQTIPFTFVTDKDGAIGSVTAPLEPQVKEIVFTRKPDRETSDPAFLERCVGEYRFVLQPELTATVARRGKGLVMQPKGQREIELEPYRGTEFRAKSPRGYGTRFVIEGDGPAQGFAMIQPNGVFEAKRVK